MATPIPTATRRSARSGRGRHDHGGGHGAAWRFLGVLLVVAVLAGGVWVGLRAVVPSAPVVVVERCTAVADGVDEDLAPDQAGNAALITAVAVRRGLPARAATIAIATARQESKLRNITYGDRDSLGLFQQRPSQGWGTAAQVQDPVYATNAFFSSMVQIADYASLPVGDVAQRVQRSAYPSAYDQYEDLARAYASALAGYSPGALTCRLRPVTGARAQAPGADGYWPRTRAVLDRATTERGATPAAPLDGGSALRLGAGGTGATATRTGWSLAEWAVAHADDLGVVAVGTSGQVWRRGASDGGWTTLSGAAAARWAPPGAAVVVVAGGQQP